MEPYRVAQHFEGKEQIVKAIYGRILAETSKFGKAVTWPNGL
jgi:hypothetical protein